MPIKPPQSQDVPSGFDPGLADPPIRFGVFGDSDVGPGVLGSSGRAAGDGPDGAIESGAGVLGVNKAERGIGVHGVCPQGTGVSGRGGQGLPGVAGTADIGPGVSGASGLGPGVSGRSGSGAGVSGRGGGNEPGVRGTGGTGPGVEGQSADGPGLLGVSGGGPGVEGHGAGPAPGVRGRGAAGPGVMGTSDQGPGVIGRGAAGFPGLQGAGFAGPGVSGTSAHGPGVLGRSENDQPAVQGIASSAAAVQGNADEGQGVVGLSRRDVGVAGHGAGTGVSGIGTVADGGERRGVGVFASGGTGLIAVGEGSAAEFVGSVTITGQLNKAGGGFRIDHPLDPANRTLAHSFVESPERKNVYDGTVALDGAGAATVTLPAWFAALNGRLCYQLTALDREAPGLHVVRHEGGGSFEIRGGVPGAEVCWQVTGVRRDPWAEANPLVEEEEKAPEECGYYLTPEAHGQPPERGLTALRHPGRPGSQPPG
ncbi:hypothetical protein ACWGB8_15910 [Kitasatospora sp. NPDC054939]